jgi:hypothetical protein
LLALSLAILFGAHVRANQELFEEFDFRLKPRFDQKPLALEEKSELRAFRIGEYSASVWRFPQGLRESLQEIQNETSAIQCDCGLFVQIYRQYSRSRDWIPGGDNLAEVIACACDTDFAYLHLADSLAHQMIQNSSYQSKGYWLLQIEKDRFLGLSERPAVMSVAGWKQEAIRSLMAELRQDEACDRRLLSPDRSIEIKFLQMLKKNGQHEHWEIHTVEKTALPGKMIRPLRKILKEFDR